MLAKGNLELNTKSTSPALNPNPAVACIVDAINKLKAVKAAWITYNNGATNINANSNGSVTPVKNDANPAANINEAICAFFSGLAVW